MCRGIWQINLHCRPMASRGAPELLPGYRPPQNLCSRLRVRFSRLPTLLARLALTKSRKRASEKSPSCAAPAWLRAQGSGLRVQGSGFRAQVWVDT